jgi:hypothetical protein
VDYELGISGTAVCWKCVICSLHVRLINNTGGPCGYSYRHRVPDHHVFHPAAGYAPGRTRRFPPHHLAGGHNSRGHDRSVRSVFLPRRLVRLPALRPLGSVGSVNGLRASPSGVRLRAAFHPLRPVHWRLCRDEQG